jgi:hypothetical protein
MVTRIPVLGGAGGRKIGHWACALEGDIGPQALLFSLFFLATMRSTGFIHHALPTMMLCLATDPKAMRPSDRGLKPLKQ